MKIALVLSSPPGYSETFFRSKIKGLQAHGHEVVLVTAAASQRFADCEHRMHPTVSKNVWLQLFRLMVVGATLLPFLRRTIRYIRLERRAGTSFKRSLEKTYLNATLLKLKVDWLHFGFATMALDRELVAKAIGATMAVSFRGFDISIYPLKHPGCYKQLWNEVDKVHTISNDLLKKAYTLGLPKTIPVQKITPAIDAAFFSCPPVVTEHDRSTEMATEHEPFSAPPQSVQFLTVGRLHWKKGYVLMLEALAALKEKGVDFTYTIVGSGTKKEYERIAFAALQLGIKDEVVFKGKLGRETVKQEYEKATIYLQYSISEGFCNAVLEAQSMKKLCIVSDAEGLSENVLHNQTGWVVPKLKPELFAAQIEHVIQLPELEKKTITERAAKRIKNEFNIEKQQAEFAAFYLK